MWGIPDVTSCPALLTPLPPVMTCTSAQQHVPYSLVCDHRKDCQDGSDEEFCVFDPCPVHLPNTCGMSQCYSIRQECDDRVDCFSKEDEVDCPTKTITRILVPDPPLIVNYDGRGKMEFSPLNLSAADDRRLSCPETHFVCPGDLYCLPVYVRCNDVSGLSGPRGRADCGGHLHVVLASTAGRASRVCVHRDHVCDGNYHLPAA
nr:hypothetical protein BaRGS_004607 [Batillaria attramentaria]